MKSFNYQMSPSDIETLIATLTVMVEVFPILETKDFGEEAKREGMYFAMSAINRLKNMDTKISANECIAILNSLIIADRINHKEYTVSKNISDICSKYLFDIQKLLPIFESYFDA